MKFFMYAVRAFTEIADSIVGFTRVGDRSEVSSERATCFAMSLSSASTVWVSKAARRLIWTIQSERYSKLFALSADDIVDIRL